MFRASGSMEGKNDMNKQSKTKKASSSVKSSSKRSCSDKATKAPAKRGTNQKTKWKIVGDKVVVPPGDYRLSDIKAMIKAFEKEGE